MLRQKVPGILRIRGPAHLQQRPIQHRMKGALYEAAIIHPCEGLQSALTSPHLKIVKASKRGVQPQRQQSYNETDYVSPRTRTQVENHKSRSPASSTPPRPHDNPENRIFPFPCVRRKFRTSVIPSLILRTTNAERPQDTPEEKNRRNLRL